MKGNKCKNCEATLKGRFCANCGQKVYTDKDKALASLVLEALHFLTHFEGKLLKTLKTIYMYPGKLSTEYCQGVRQKYYKPVSLYLLIVILYLLFPIASGMNMAMESYKATPFLGNAISTQIEEKRVELNVSEQVLSQQFHQTSKSTSKILLLLMIPLAVPLLYLLYFKRKRYVFDNIILASEMNIFFLLTIFLLIPLLSYPVLLLFNVGMSDAFISTIALAVFAMYSSVIFHRVFREKWWISVTKAGIFCLLFIMMVVLVYRTIVFQVTFAFL